LISYIFPQNNLGPAGAARDIVAQNRGRKFRRSGTDCTTRRFTLGTICWKCGMEVPAGGQSCPACGAAVAGTGGQAAQPFAPAASPFAAAGTPAAPPVQGYSSPPPPPSTPFQPAAPTPPPAFSSSQPPPQQGFAPVQQSYTPLPPPPLPPPGPVPGSAGKGGSNALKIILIIVGIFIFLVILVVGILGYIGYRAVHAVREAAHGNSITIPGSAGGSFSVNSAKAYSAEELGTDIYPGATPIKGSMKLAMPTGTFITGVFSTSDTREQVVAFYKSRFGGDSGLMESDDASVLTLKKSEKETVMVTVTNKANENDGRTKIAILHTTGK